MAANLGKRTTSASKVDRYLKFGLYGSAAYGVFAIIYWEWLTYQAKLAGPAALGLIIFLGPLLPFPIILAIGGICGFALAARLKGPSNSRRLAIILAAIMSAGVVCFIAGPLVSNHLSQIHEAEQNAMMSN